MKSRILLFILLSCQVSFAQTGKRDTQQLIDAEKIRSIYIDTDEVYLLSIISAESSQIRIKTHSEGEYFHDILVETSVEDSELRIKTKYPQRLVNGFDKLSAHKIFSLEIELEIPEDMEVIISSNIASLEANGKFKSISADLKQGYCMLMNFEGNAVINTYSGNIYVETTSGLIEANSRNGEVETPEFLPGRNPIRLTSIDGTIIVRKN